MANISSVRGYGACGITNPGYATETAIAPGLLPPPTMPSPSAPPASMFDSVPGYEGTVAGGGGGFLPPPMPSFPVPQPEVGPNMPQWNIPSITEDQAREALTMFVSRQPVDAYAQPSPGPWDIAAKTPSFFHDGNQVIKVPYTSSVKNCHVCIGMGRTPCTDCSSSGSKVCWVCNGSGRRHGEDRCYHCSGRGRENCNFCHGQGSKECKTCHGRRQLLVFINLKVKWTNNIEDYVVEQSSGLHVTNLSSVSGKKLFKDTQYMVYPVMGFPDPGVVTAAERLVKNHQVKYSQTSRILQQRQSIELIPITKVTYQWKGNSHVYVVYGNELKVSADNYPATCCCCTIM